MYKVEYKLIGKNQPECFYVEDDIDTESIMGEFEGGKSDYLSGHVLSPNGDYDDIFILKKSLIESVLITEVVENKTETQSDEYDELVADIDLMNANIDLKVKMSEIRSFANNAMAKMNGMGRSRHLVDADISRILDLCKDDN